MCYESSRARNTHEIQMQDRPYRANPASRLPYHAGLMKYIILSNSIFSISYSLSEYRQWEHGGQDLFEDNLRYKGGSANPGSPFDGFWLAALIDEENKNEKVSIEEYDNQPAASILPLMIRKWRNILVHIVLGK